MSRTRTTTVAGTLLLLALVLGVGIWEAEPARAIKDGVDSPDLRGQVQFIVSSTGPISGPEDLVGNPDEYECVGTLISSKWVLTAKHCVTQSSADTENSGVLVGDLRKGQGTPHRLASITPHRHTDSALLELTEDANEMDPVSYRTGTPEVDDEVEIRGWGSEETDVLQLATMEVADLHWTGATEGNRMLLRDAAEGVPELGDSGAGVDFGGHIYGLVSTVSTNEASAVPTTDIAAWIRRVSGVGPALSLEDLAAVAEAQQRGHAPFPLEQLVGMDGPLTADTLMALPDLDEPPASASASAPASASASASPTDPVEPGP